MERNYKLYVHISPSGKRYYGITKMNVEKRWGNGKNYCHNKHFTYAIQKHGWDNFQHEVLFNNLTEAEAKLLEQFYIALYDTTNQDKGYNVSFGGESASGYKHTEEWKQKMSGKNNPMYGKNLSGEKHPFYGKHHSENSKLKISESRKGLYIGKNNPNAKSVICITTGRIFFTTKEGAKHYNIKNRANISGCCKGKLKSAGKLSDGTKLVWKYLNYKHNKKYRVIKNKEVA